MKTSKTDGTTIGIEADVPGEGSIDVKPISGASESTGLVVNVSTYNAE